MFRQEGTNALYMAGLYNFYQDELRFVILTTEANESIRDVHHRMPLVIPGNELETWIFDDSYTSHILNRVPPKLVRELI